MSSHATLATAPVRAIRVVWADDPDTETTDLVGALALIIRTFRDEALFYGARPSINIRSEAVEVLRAIVADGFIYEEENGMFTIEGVR